MSTRRSFLPSAIFFLASSSIVFATHRLACNIPRNFTVDLTSTERAKFYKSELTISLKKDALVVTSDRGTDRLNVRANANVVVTFEGYLVMNDVDRRIFTEPEKISQTYVDRISGMVQRVPHNSTGSEMNRCRLVLLPIEVDRPAVHRRISNEIHRFAESCVELEICSRIDKISVRPEIDAARFPIAANPSKHWDPRGCDEVVSSVTVQLAINKLVDVGLGEAIAKLTKRNGGTIVIPNIDKLFPVNLGFVKTNAHFEAVNGTFRDLSTIRRIVDATLSHDGMKFMASCEFGLTIAHLRYSHYRLKHQLVKVNGKLSGSVDGAALKARIAVDYNRKPCVLSVEYLKVTEFGKMTVDLTGLGALNYMTSKLINWITKAWRDNIIHTMENEMRTSIESKLSSLDCEKFRP